MPIKKPKRENFRIIVRDIPKIFGVRLSANRIILFKDIFKSRPMFQVFLGTDERSQKVFGDSSL